MTEDRPARRSPRHARPRRLAPLALGVVFLFTPAAAYVGGVRATEIENRRLTAFPSVSQGWDFFPQLSAWATDHLPLRDRAVAANTQLSEAVFGEPPQYGGPAADTAPAAPVAPVAPAPAGAAPAEQDARTRTFPPVLRGEDGWLFYGADVQGPCEPLVPLEQTLARLTRLGQIVQASGRTYRFTVAPDKSTMNPDRMPGSYVGESCAREAKAAFWRAVREAPPPGYVELRRPLERLAAAGVEGLWRPSDTHWAPRGALVYAQELAESLDPALWRTSRVVPDGTVRLKADLAVQLGTPRTDEVPAYRLERDGVVVQEASESRLRSTTTGAPLHTPATLVLGDSFTQASRPYLAPLFRDARIVHPVTAKDDPETVLPAVRDARTVVFEIVERSVVRGDVPLTEPGFLDRLEAALAQG